MPEKGQSNYNTIYKFKLYARQSFRKLTELCILIQDSISNIFLAKKKKANRILGLV